MVSHSNPTSYLSKDMAYIELMLFEIGKIINKEVLVDSDLYDFTNCIDDIVDRAKLMNEEMG